MSKVYIVNKGVHDYSDARRFGELVFLSEGAMNKYEISNMVREFAEKLLTSSPDDYLLTTGLTTMCVVAGGMFSRIHGRVNLLIYKPSRKGGPGRYLERRVDYDQFLGR